MGLHDGRRGDGEEEEREEKRKDTKEERGENAVYRESSNDSERGEKRGEKSEGEDVTETLVAIRSQSIEYSLVATRVMRQEGGEEERDSESGERRDTDDELNVQMRINTGEPGEHP